MNMMNLILIAFIVVMVYDYTEFPRTFLSKFYSLIFRKHISKDMVKLPTILECSFCATFWSTLLFQLITKPITLNSVIVMVCLSLLCAFLTPFILSLINLINRVLQLLTYSINTALDRIINRIDK